MYKDHEIYLVNNIMRQFLNSKLEEWLLFASTQQFQGLDIVGIKVTESGNSLQSNVSTGMKSLTEELHSLDAYSW